jgi:2-isopropylmalate synthase
MRTISTTLNNCAISIPVGYSVEDIDEAWASICKAKKPRLQVRVPLSTVQMEYICHKKPAAVLEMIRELVTHCRDCCSDVDFTAEDATRSEPEFLRKAISIAVECGASTVTVSDAAGTMLPDEFGAFIQQLKLDIPQLENVNIAASCMNELNMSTACAVTAVKAGASEIKAAVSGDNVTTVSAIARIIKLRGDDSGIKCGINTMEMQRLSKQIEWLTRAHKGGASPFDTGVRINSGDEFFLNVYDDIEAVRKASVNLGYELSEDDLAKVFESFKGVANKKEVSARELEVIIASVALQVPPTYRLVSYVINSGNIINATSHIVLEKAGKTLDGLCAGDGPIDASFLAIEQIVGTHYELDDFQIQAVTEGREAMGSAVVKLRSGGKLYSGRGISTDIIGASIHAYINALNKIVYEEN